VAIFINEEAKLLSLVSLESYNKSHDKNPNFIPEIEELVADAEKKLNMDGKSFLYVTENAVYTPTGKEQQTYTIIGKKIFNKNGEEVFSTDSKDRNKIFANLAVQNKRAVVVEYRGEKYVVNDRNQIISATTGDEMKWGEENGDRKAILALSKAAFEAKQKAETTIANSKASLEGVKAGVVHKHQGNWSRQEVQNNPKILYVFTDNTDRDSGSGVISADSWYSKKYGVGHHFPTMTAAVVRGLNNSRPISTQRWYHQGAKGEAGRWIDADIEEFKTVIRDELQEIVNEFSTGKYDTIMFPDGDSLFNTRISKISKTRTPQALRELLYEFGFDSLIPSDITINQGYNRLNNKEINYGEEFRRVQEECRKVGGISGRAATLTEADKQRLAVLLRKELES
jgi:hypothetical protein